MRFSLNLTSSIWHMVPHFMSISNMRAKNVNQFTFSIEQMFCKGKNDGLAIHHASERKKYFRRRKKLLIWSDMDGGWMDGWMGGFYFIQNANISGIKLFENMIPYVDPLFISQLKNILFFFVRMKSVIRNKKCAQLYFNKFIAIFFYDFAWFVSKTGISRKLKSSWEQMVFDASWFMLETIRFNWILCISLSIFDSSIEMQ